MAGQRTLLVPIRIDALFVKSTDPPFGSPMADFAKLPYNLADNSTRNGNVPNLAEVAFGRNEALSFPKGLHRLGSRTGRLSRSPRSERRSRTRSRARRFVT